MKPLAKHAITFASLLLVSSALTASLTARSAAQAPAFGTCKPVSERTGEVGCWTLIDQPVGKIEPAQISWHLDVYPTRAEAEKAKGPRGTVLESLGKVWLLTIEKAGWRPAIAGQRIAKIGPLPVTAGEAYSALFMEAILDPGRSSAIHVHSGPKPGTR